MPMRKIPISGHTELIGLIATPIRHSMSPAMHNAAFEKLGMDKVYLVFEVGKEGLEATVNGLRAMGVRGWNVSMPNKTAVIPYLDKITPAAEMCGSVNTVINDGGTLTGTITDGTGWMQSVREEGIDLTGKKITLLGAGGAATAILVQAALDGVAEISVFNRQDEFWARAEEKTALVREKTSCKVNLFHLEDREALRSEIASSYLLANATSAGMKPQDDICLVDSDMLRPGLVVTDCIYNPKVTILLDRAEKAGCKAIGGLGMMLYQGAEAFRLWTGEEMPVDYVRQQLGL